MRIFSMDVPCVCVWLKLLSTKSVVMVVNLTLNLLWVTNSDESGL